MDTNELRLTNWVSSKLHGGLHTEIFSILSHEKVKLGANPLAIYDAEEIEGIPLTKEWLLKFGFKFDGYIYEGSEELRQKSNKDIGVKYQAYFFNSRLNRWMDCQTRVCVDYVHQLQNLYFALTGEELTLKTE